MQKGKTTNILAIILGVVVVLVLYSYWSSSRYDKQKTFFVNSCVDTFYDTNGYGFNDVMYEFTNELPQGMQDYIGREFSNDYLSEISSENIESFCGGIYDLYREAREENRYDYCENYRCR